MRPTTLAGRYCGPPGQPCPPPSSRYTTTGGHPGADQVSRVTRGSPGASGSRSRTGSPLIPLPVAQSLAAAAGLRAHDALAAGSWSARAYLGLGGLIPGAPADAVVYDADPRLDLDRLNAPAPSSSAAVSCPAVGRADRPSVPVRQLWPGMYQGQWPWLRGGRDAQGPSRKFLPAG